MPSLRHEVLVDLCRTLPALLAELLAGRLGAVDIEGARFEIDEPTLSQLTQLDADLVLRVLGPDGRLRCVLVGPRQIPLVTTPEQAHGRPELALLSGLAHPDAPEAERIGTVLWNLLDHCDDARGGKYWDLFLETVSETTRRKLTMELDHYVPRTPCLRKLYDKGLAKGLRRGVLEGETSTLIELAEDLGLELSPGQWTAIVTCDDRDRLRRWRRRMVTASSLDQVFES